MTNISEIANNKANNIKNFLAEVISQLDEFTSQNADLNLSYEVVDDDKDLGKQTLVIHMNGDEEAAIKVKMLSNEKVILKVGIVSFDTDDKAEALDLISQTIVQNMSSEQLEHVNPNSPRPQI